MKFSKLALASVAALGLAGVAQADPTYYVEESLELWSANPELTTPQTGANVYGNTDNGGAVWFGAAADDTAILAYEGNVPSGSNKFPTKNGEATTVGSKYLKVSNSSTLWRMLQTYSWEGEKPTAFPVAEDGGVTVGEGLFVDTLVQFTPSEDPPTVEEGSKLIVWMNTNGVLCVTAGCLCWDTENEPTAVRTDFETTTTLTTNTWYRLTVSAFSNILQGEDVATLGWILNGFEVRIDGQKVTTKEGQPVADAGFTAEETGLIALKAVNEAAAASITARQFFGSLQTGFAATLAAVGFKGEGLVDDILVSDLLPTFTADVSGIDFTLTWDEGVSAVWYAIGDTTNSYTTTVTTGLTVGQKVAYGGAWGVPGEITLADGSNQAKVSLATTGGAAGVTNSTLAALTPAAIKTAFGDNVTPEQINADPYAGLDYDLGQNFGYITGAPELKIVDIAQNGDNWDIKVQVLATVKEGGENPVPLAIDSNNSENPKLRATLQIKAAATLAELEGATPAKKTIVYDATATDLTISVPAVDGQFFKAYIGPEQSNVE